MEAVSILSKSLLSLIVLALIAFAIMFNMVGQLDSLREILSQYDSYTNHALNTHSDQSWNPVTINDYMKSGKCKPSMYACPDNGYNVMYCEISPGKSIGLIEAISGKIITGFFARTSYWENRCH